MPRRLQTRTDINTLATTNCTTQQTVRPFQDGTEEYTASIAIDASTNGDVTTAVAVAATRDEELEILNRIHTAANEHDKTFIPFKSKSSKFSKQRDTDFFTEVLEEGSSWASGFHFQHHSASRNQHYVEAVLGAILVKALPAKARARTFVLLDGDRNKVNTFAKACDGINIGSPTIANCYKSEWYYPHALLADLSAGYLSYQIDNGRYNYTNPTIRVPAADRTEPEDWGKAFSFLQRKQDRSGYNYFQIGSATSNNESERARIWYDGLVSHGSNSQPASTRLEYISEQIRESGYANLANRIEAL